MESRDQNNLEFLLAMGTADLERWLVGVPEEYLNYIDWLLDKVETEIDTFILDDSGLRDANDVIEKVRNGLQGSGKTSTE